MKLQEEQKVKELEDQKRLENNQIRKEYQDFNCKKKLNKIIVGILSSYE